MTAAAPALLLSLWASAAPPPPDAAPAVVPAFGTSLGRGPRATARLTFDRRKAAGGGLVYAAPSTSARDAEALRLSEAVLTTTGGLLSHAAVLARRHRVAAAVLKPARWLEGPSLEVSVPRFGAPRRGPGGILFEPLESSQTLRLREGDVVSVDPAAGTVTAYGPAEGALELALSEALRGYDGLGDPLALVQWVEARAREPGGPRQARRLVSELAERALLGRARSADLERVLRAARRALPAGERGPLDAASGPLLAGLSGDAQGRLEEAREAARSAGTRLAVARLLEEAEGLERRLGEVAGALGRSAPEGPRRLLRSLRELARARSRSLPEGRADQLALAVEAAGARAPERAVLAGSLYRRFVSDGGLAPLIEDISSDASLPLKRKSERIRELFAAGGPGPDSEVMKEVLSRRPAGALLMVWVSTASGREIVPASKFDSAVRRAWASWWDAEDLGRRKRLGLTRAEPEVTVQAVSPAQVSGLLWTRDPVTGERGRAVVEAVLGEGAGLAAGEAAADQYVLDPRTGRELLPALVADKRVKWALDGAAGRLVQAAVPEGLALSRCLGPQRLRRLARLSRALDDHFGEPLEVEFSFSGDRLLVLSARVLPPPPPPPGAAAVTPAGSLPAPDVPGVRSLP